MAKFRKKPVVIEAIQFNGVEQVDDCPTLMFDLGFDPPDWMVEAAAKSETAEGAVYEDSGYLKVVTLEGEHLAIPGDWIIRGVKGELYPCKPDIFAASYEAA